MGESVPRPIPGDAARAYPCWWVRTIARSATPWGVAVMYDDLLYARELVRQRLEEIERRQLIREAERKGSRRQGLRLDSGEQTEFQSPDGRKSTVKRAA